VGRAYARKLELKGERGWKEWSKSGQRPSDIPGNPNKVYRDDGWISWPDWLGYGSEGGAAASRGASSSSSTYHPSDLPPPPPPSHSPFEPNVKTEPPSSKSSGGSSDRSTEPPPCKIKKEEYCNTSTSTSPLTSRQDPFSFLARAVTVPERGVYGTGRGVLTLVKRDSNPPVTGLRVIVSETLT
jgi:hypothetical protein